LSAPDLALKPLSVGGAPVVELVADLSCPWCWLGFRRLRRLQREAGLAIRWAPFLLDPWLPAEGVERAAWRARRMGSREAAERQERRLVELGRAEGLAFAFARIRRTPRTVAAHGLVLQAQRRGLVELAAERLFAAFLADGRDIGDPAVLAAEAAALGLEPAPADAAAVLEAHARAVAAKIGGVPLYRFLPGLSIAGAQPLECLRALLDVARMRLAAEAQGRQGS
jgi:predicted DsbA family dithiol-disulfide isomerase